jgi:hypothetical protein
MFAIGVPELHIILSICLVPAILVLVVVAIMYFAVRANRQR